MQDKPANTTEERPAFQDSRLGELLRQPMLWTLVFAVAMIVAACFLWIRDEAFVKPVGMALEGSQGGLVAKILTFLLPPGTITIVTVISMRMLVKEADAIRDLLKRDMEVRAAHSALEVRKSNLAATVRAERVGRLDLSTLSVQQLDVFLTLILDLSVPPTNTVSIQKSYEEGKARALEKARLSAKSQGEDWDELIKEAGNILNGFSPNKRSPGLTEEERLYLHSNPKADS